MLSIQTPSPKPTTTPDRPNRPRSISIYAFSVRVHPLATAARMMMSHPMLTFHRPERNGRKTLTTVQGIPSKFDHKKILKVVKKDFGRCTWLPRSLPPDAHAG